MDWKPGQFKTYRSDGQAKVDGFVSGVFGIHDTGSRRGCWIVSHLPTGLRLTQGRGFLNIETAKAFAGRLAPLTDWTNVDQNAPDMTLAVEVSEIWNDLVMLDVAKNIVDHYGR